MKQALLITVFITQLSMLQAQDRMTPETLWKLGRVSAVGLTRDSKSVVYSVSTPDMEANKSNKKSYVISLANGMARAVSDTEKLVRNSRISPDGKYLLAAKEVKLRKVFGKDVYPDLPKSNVQIYDGLGYRHWDEWEDGEYSHVFLQPLVDGKPGEGVDIMKDLPYDCPQKPFGGEEDYIWSPDSKSIVYVTKPAYGTQYAVSTNTEIFQYDLASGKTTNLSKGMMGYDTHPVFSPAGTLAWLSMKRNGYEADKQDIVVKTAKGIVNLTAGWDNSVDGFVWSADGQSIYFNGAIGGAKHLFVIDKVFSAKPSIQQLTHGDFDIAEIVGQSGNALVVSRTDMNHAAELYTVDLSSGKMEQVTHVNDAIYAKIGMSKIEKRLLTTTDKKKLTVWVIYPPGFDPSKKYPTLLYCQGGPQSPLTQSYSFRWNFQLMAANGYIVVAPNRRGMYGHGQDWNEQISKDWGGQVMKDYLTAIDEISKEPFVDKDRRGCVGASYGGYSAYYLAGIHQNRFKTFIAHDGIYDIRSMSGTTEELWFTNWEFGGNYWDKNNKTAQKSFNDFNPISHVDKWNTPILIVQGGKDYRVPIEQGLMAFHAAQARGIKSKLLYFPDENHWVLKPQNALVWQREFFGWLNETLNGKSF
ncbi:S9 family peptidase [Flavisolibacter nicotianae]|uniref:S9 family peptidase n=1 Tax=Flavisolibacter nicotianae TaxID=2364882 RepID=UPI000EAEBABE|nr:S9 family peptidase [Flavisolibacter nicotianae]